MTWGAGYFSLNTALGVGPLDAPELFQSSVLSCHQNGLHSVDKDKSTAGPASASSRQALLSPQASVWYPGRLLLPWEGKDTGVQRRPGPPLRTWAAWP